MLFDFAALLPPDRYKLLASTIVPRPIAWMVSQDREDRLNAAPFSFFNVFGDDPPVVCIGIGPRDGGADYKDTGANIRATGEFVVNLDTTSSSTKVTPPRIAESPVAFECARHSVIEFGNRTTLVVGKVLAMHVHDEAVLDARACRIDTPRLGLVGRVEGADGYIRASGPGVFRRPRPTLEDWRRERE